VRVSSPITVTGSRRLRTAFPGPSSGTPALTRRRYAGSGRKTTAIRASED